MPAVGDIHPLTGVEVTFGNDSSQIHLLRGNNGFIILPWPFVIDETTRVRISPAVADINADDNMKVGSDLEIGT